MHYVYILRSINHPNQIYIGSSSNLKNRFESHNLGSNKHTSKFKPWKIVWCSAFITKFKAESFEKYLKSSSGIAFRRKRLL
ncbi:excinuclease ABC subunit C [Candidatus Wolfebacteria bacterium CG10_big_fil_rev_8_21_14_0_10_31_9]|uniref:Excinuclease ABC subunit C n=1 Tax=Candidatus Wolfebacteria bacterium CG10_big_fil_rev_8_21_14_0_10_31_9 TaxID=1975070 RepID=A0A2H0RCD1_9BACT|nr:MAG: excinuclease ABC subunit C [Candidatus Wolfebacteria bacterium CG10_big_fil_rev_8_21_14_0_10_31_9]